MRSAVGLAAEATAVAGNLHVEELEVNAQALCKTDVRRFLEECLVPEGEIASTIELASEIADTSGSAVLRVELGPTSAMVTATAPGSGAPRGESPLRPHSAGEPLLETLLTA